MGTIKNSKDITEDIWKQIINFLSKSNSIGDKVRFKCVKKLSYDDVQEILNHKQEMIDWDVSCTRNHATYIYNETLEDMIEEFLKSKFANTEDTTV